MTDVTLECPQASLVYVVVPIALCRGRLAVRSLGWHDNFASRPRPDSWGDMPVRDYRGMYTRPDGSQYTIDEEGVSHSLRGPAFERSFEEIKDV